MTKIVVLDGYALNPGDLSWTVFHDLGECVVYDRTPTDQILNRARDATILLTNKTPLTARTLASLQDLRYIGVLATGYNIVDVAAATDLGIVVTNVPSYSTHSVAQMVFALLLELCHHVQLHSDAVKGGEWTRSQDFCFWKAPLIELQGKTMGIVGLGQIGRQVAKIADALGMRVLASSRTQKDPLEYPGFRWVPLDELLQSSDVVSLHCPLFPETEGMINKRTLALMSDSAFLINTARGGLIVEADLAEALNNGKIAGAGLDVLTAEPPSTANSLLQARNCLITPHISWATAEARTRLMVIAADNLRAFLTGQPVHVVKS
ncbi:MAG: D-2-hydroxyacid dehydrogenase [Ruminococcaceae bacterium]|nr:D-2-hydroxyacid dehydrogenase [Oscillospiraceae bacterium]